jgi:hypothetical protein
VKESRPLLLTGLPGAQWVRFVNETQPSIVTGANLLRKQKDHGSSPLEPLAEA